MGDARPLDQSVPGTIASLQREDAPDLVSRVLGLFAEDAPRRAVEIVEGTETLDVERVRIAAHTLKSSAANVGAARLARRRGEIEHAAREANPVACVALADALGDLLGDTLAALEAFDTARARAHPERDAARSAA